ncbi:hypothetical protein [Paracoccus suum]|uniref:hypothetical protein n=1 Tax=Paracoccus suum TaxID=2259340 RepID=UPI0013B0528A|nr:hypothetical protein [Paracoccus suum]
MQPSPTSLEQMRAHFELLDAGISSGRAELIRLHRAGLIEDETLHNLERDLDIEEVTIRFQLDDLSD